MEAIIDTFHVDVKIIIAQAVNFAIVFSVLYYFAIKPLLKVMKERGEKIEESLKDAEKIKIRIAQTEDDYKAEIVKARKEANGIIEEASKRADEKKDEMVKKAKEEIGAVINKEKEGIRAEKEKTLKEIKKEVADLIVVSLEKVLEERITGEEDKKLIDRILVKVSDLR